MTITITDAARICYGEAMAEQLITRSKPKRIGDYSAVFTIHGINVTVGYDLEGVYLSATETDPSEAPCVEIVSVDFGSGPVFGAQANEWNECLNLWELVEDYEVRS